MDKEKADKNLDTIINRIQKETDLDTLKEYRRLFKKKISVFNRSWAAAWLFMYYDKKETPDPAVVKNRTSQTPKTR